MRRTVQIKTEMINNLLFFFFLQWKRKQPKNTPNNKNKSISNTNKKGKENQITDIICLEFRVFVM